VGGGIKFPEKSEKNSFFSKNSRIFRRNPLTNNPFDRKIPEI
jgi:hypothetical protein